MGVSDVQNLGALFGESRLYCYTKDCKTSGFLVGAPIFANLLCGSQPGRGLQRRFVASCHVQVKHNTVAAALEMRSSAIG